MTRAGYVRGPLLRRTSHGRWRLAVRCRCGHVDYVYLPAEPDADDELIARAEAAERHCLACWRRFGLEMGAAGRAVAK